MPEFVDPRTNPTPLASGSVSLVADSPDQVEDLHRLCREGRIYDVEAWIRAGRPLQLAREARPRGRQFPTALEIAIETGQQGLVLLLLCNGYRLDLEPSSPFNLALKSRRWDLVDLLWAWGADPVRVSPRTVFETYNTALFERFYTAGVDFMAHHALADTLANHTSNKPLFGFAKRHRDTDPRFQGELNIALGEHVEEENLKGVHLCLWAGADPHAPAPDLYGTDAEEPSAIEGRDGETDRFIGWSAVERAVIQGSRDILRLLKPDPAHDDFEDLYTWAKDSWTVEALAAIAPPPHNIGGIIQHHSRYLDAGWPFDSSHASAAIGVLEALFKAGGRWIEGTPYEISSIRRDLLKARDGDFVTVFKLFMQDEHCAPGLLQALARPPSIRHRLAAVGLLPSPHRSDPAWTADLYRARKARDIAIKLGIPVPKPMVPPASVA